MLMQDVAWTSETSPRQRSLSSSPGRRRGELSVSFCDDNLLVSPDSPEPLHECRFGKLMGMECPEPLRETLDAMPPSSLVFMSEDCSPRTAEKTCHSSARRVSGAEPLRLVKDLLQMVIRELCEQMKNEPIHQQGCLEIHQYAESLKSIAKNEYPMCLPIAQFDHAITGSRCLDKSFKRGGLEPIYLDSPSRAASNRTIGGRGPLSPTSNDLTPTRTISDVSQCTQLTRTVTNTSELTKALVNVFNELDEDGSGTLSREELRAALLAVDVPAARAQKILNAADVDGSGEIDLSEWKAAVAQGGDEEVRKVSAQLLRLSASGSSILKPPAPVQEPCCMLLPDSSLRLVWDVILTFLCVYVAFMLPFTNGFDNWIEGDEAEFLLQFELIVDLVFLFDVCLNFRTAIMEKDGSLTVDWRRVAYRYISSWFILDLVSSIPFSKVSGGQLAGVRVLKLLKIPKIIRALRVIKPILMAQSELVTVLDEKFSSPVLRAVSRRSVMFILTILLCHWLACLMAFCSNIWLIEYLDGKDYEPSLWRSYLVAVYWAMTTMTTVGYGDITPSTDGERAYTTIAMVIGGAYYGYAVGTIVSIVSNRDLNASAYHDRMDEIYAWLDHHRFPAEMRRRIIRYFKGYLTEKAAIDEADVVNELSPALRNEVGKLVLHEDIRNNPIFDNLPISAVTRLHKIVHKVYIEEGQTVVQEGEVGTAMFIVGKGMVRMEYPPDVNGHKRPPRVLCSGDSFGEEILSGLEESYAYTVVAIKKTASLFMIEEEAFQQLFEHMQNVKDQVIKNVGALRDASMPSAAAF